MDSRPLRRAATSVRHSKDDCATVGVSMASSSTKSARALRARDPSSALARSRPYLAVDNSNACGLGGVDA